MERTALGRKAAGKAGAGKGRCIMKLGFAKKKCGEPKENITRDRDPKTKELLGGLAVATVLLAGISAVSLKVAKKFQKED